MVTAVAVALIGHAWAVTFGDMAASFAALQKGDWTSSSRACSLVCLFIALAGIFCAIFALHCYGGMKAVKHGWVPAVVVGGAMSISLYFIAQWHPSLATFLAGIVGMVVTALLCRVGAFNTEQAIADADAIAHGADDVGGKGTTVTKKMGFNLAFAAYYALIAVVMIVSFVPGLEDALKEILVLKLDFNEYATGYGWVTAAGSSSAVGIFSHTGALLVYAAVIGMIIYAATGHWKQGAFSRVMKRVAKNGLGSSIATTSMVLMAFIMVELGMTAYTSQRCSNCIWYGLPCFCSSGRCSGCLYDR